MPLKRDCDAGGDPAADCEAATVNPQIRGLRIGVAKNYYTEVHDKVTTAHEQSLAVFESPGAVRVPLTVPFYDHLATLGTIITEVEVENPVRTSDEPRTLVIGRIGEKFWSAVTTPRDGKVRIISVRRALRAGLLATKTGDTLSHVTQA